MSYGHRFSGYGLRAARLRETRVLFLPQTSYLAVSDSFVVRASNIRALSATATTTCIAFSMLTQVFLVLCIIVLFPRPILGQEAQEKRQSHDPSQSLLHDPDVPVLGTEAEKAEAKQAEAREEALKSLFVYGRHTVLPIPSFHYNRNESYWAGLVVPILRSNEKDELKDISAPFYVHNQFVEETFGLYHFGYPSDTTQYSVTADYSTKMQRDIDLTYKNVSAGGGRYILAGRGNWFKNPFRRVFGVGNQTLESDEASYTSKGVYVDLTVGIHLNEDVALMWTEHYHNTRIDQGVINSLPQAQMRFPQLDGIEGADILGHKLTFRYDTRDKQLITTRGTFVTFSLELNQNLLHRASNPWVRTTIDARHLIPHYNDQLVFVARFLADTVNGNRIPFYELPSLGGETTLRGFGQSRFIDETALLINLEERIPVLQQNVLGYLLDLEVAPFLDIGRVMSGFSSRDFKNFQVNPGIGLRVHAKPNIIARLDVAYGRDGDNFFAGLDYPF